MSPLDKKLNVLLQRGTKQPHGVAAKWSMGTLAQKIEDTEADTKEELPLVSFGTFNGDYRSGENVQTVSAVAVDYDGKDGKRVTIKTACQSIEAAGVAALVYSSPRHDPKGDLGPRWRAVFPLAADVTPEEAAPLQAAAIAILGHVVKGGESTDTARAWFYGHVTGKTPVICEIEGKALTAHDFKPITSADVAARDGDRSDALFALACKIRRRGGTLAEFEAAWPQDETAAAHVLTRSDGKKKPAKEQRRALDRAWANSANAEKESIGVIRIESDQLNENLAKLDKAFVDCERPIFQRGHQIVAVRIGVEGLDAEGEKISVPLIQPMNVQQIQQEAMHVTGFEKWNGAAKKIVPIECPENFAKHYLQRLNWRLPYLHAIVTHPTLAPNGELINQPGYDSATGIFYEPSIEFEPIPDKPNALDVLFAVRKFERLLRGFEFESDASRALYIAMLITGIVRPALSTAPLFGVSAPTAGSGKTLLARGASLIVRGEEMPISDLPSSEEELEKRLFAALRAGRRFMLMDNASRPLESDALNAYCTAPKWGARVLGLSEELHLPTNMLLIVTGNQLAIQGDLVTRTFICRLEPSTPEPTQRAFAWSFEDECREKRGALIEAALTIVRAGLNGPPVKATPTRFPEFDKFVRFPLIAAGLPDIVETMQPADVSGGNQNMKLAAVLKAINEAFGAKPITVAQMIEDKRVAAALSDAAGEFDGQPDPRSVGNWLRNHKGQFVDRIALRSEPKSGHAGRWRLVRG